jgi:hypothetical protein
MGTGKKMSLGWAEFLSYWSNWALLFALLVGLVATFAVVVSSNVKEGYFKLAIADANTRASDAAATAESEKIARIKLEAQFAWRRIDDEQKKVMISELSKSPQSVFIIWVTGDPEAMLLAWQLINIFQKSNWHAGGEGRQYPDSIVTNLVVGGHGAAAVLPLLAGVGLSPAEGTMPPFTGMVIPHPTGLTETNADVVIVVGSRLRPDDAAVLDAVKGSLGPGQ